MDVKGTAYISRRDIFVEKLGERAFGAFEAEFAEEHPDFQIPILASTRIPVTVFLAFNDAVIDRFFGGDPMTYWELGERSADFHFDRGPYKNVFYNGGYQRFLRSFPQIWQAFCSEGACSGTLKDGAIEVRIAGVPVRHVHFEYSVIGFLKRGLELTGSPPIAAEKVRGFSTGDDEVFHRFVLDGA